MEKSNLELIKKRLKNKDIIPYDETSSLEIFLSTLKYNTELRNSLYEQINSDEEWTKRALSEDLYFIVNCRVHPKKRGFKSSVRLGFVGPENVPTISINI